MRPLIAVLFVCIFCFPLAANASEWEWLPYKDAVAVKASEHAPAIGDGKTPRLVVSCNNLIRLAYLEWPSDLGIKLKELPNHAYVTLILKADETLSEIWFVSRPEKTVTTVISHDRAFPSRLTEHSSVALRAKEKQGLFDLTATFPLTGLADIMEAHNLPCR